MRDTDPKAAGLSAEQRARLAALVRAFDDSWDENRLAAAVGVLPPADDPFRRVALAEMVKVDLGRQWREGKHVTLDDYLQSYPELGTPETVAPDLRRAEEAARRSAGETGQQVNLSARLPRQSEALRGAVPEAAGAKPAADSRATPAPQGFRRKQTVELPEQFGRYRIFRQLGQGGMGAVYLAEDTQLERPVALKVPHFDPQAGREVRERFLREARAAAKFTHPNICPLFDVGEIDGVPYLTMPFIEGKSLADFVRPDRRQGQAQVAAVVRKLALALEEAHARGFVHRDLKPANVMINERKEPVIMDFGLARRYGADASRVTGSGAVVGTPAYMAPEQIRNKGVGPASDQYSLGVILYELLTGEVPFTGPVAAVLGQVLHSEPEPPGKLRPDLDPALEAICLKAMAKDPVQRFPSAKGLADALGRYLDSARGKEPAAPQPRPTAPTADGTPPPSANRPRAAATQQMHVMDVPPPTLVPPAGSPFEGLDDEPAPPVKPPRRPPAAKPHAPVPLWSRLPPVLKQRWPLVAAAAGGLAVVLLLGIVFLLRTPEGTLRVEVDAGGEDVQVTVDDGEVLVASGPVRLKPGEHTLAVRVNGADVPVGKTVRMLLGQKKLSVKLDDAELKGQQFSITRGGNRVLRVELLPEGVAAATPPPAADFVSLFHGTNLSGWTVMKTTGANYETHTPSSGGWEARNGEIVCTSAESTWLRLDRPYADFLLELEFKLPPDGNSDVYVRCPGQGRLAVDGMAIQLIDDSLPQLQPDQKTGAIHNVVAPSASVSRPAGQWNSMQIRCEGDAVEVTLNGTRVIQADMAKVPALQGRPRSGSIGLANWRGEANGAAFRNIRIKDLGGAAAAPAPPGPVTPFAEITVVRHFQGHGQSVGKVGFSADGKRAITCSFDKTVRVWDVATGAQLQNYTGHDKTTNAVALSPDGKLALSVGSDKSIHLWEVDAGRELHRFEDHTDVVYDVAFSPKGDRFVSGGEDRTVRVWDVGNKTALHTCTGHTDRVNTVAFTPDGNAVLSSSYDKSVRLWGCADGRQIRQFTGHGAWVRGGVAVSPDGKRVVSGSGGGMRGNAYIPGADQSVRVWDLETGQELDRFAGAWEGGVVAVAFVPDNRHILFSEYAAMKANPRLFLWDLVTKKEVASWRYHETIYAPVGCIAAAPDGRHALVCCGFNADPKRSVALLQLPLPGVPTTPAATVSLPAGGPGAGPAPAGDGWVSLFNGTNLSGWSVQKTSGANFEVHESGGSGWEARGGELHCTSREPNWLKSDRQYGDFVLDLEYKLPPQGNTGVYVRSPGTGRLSSTGMEIQLIDENYPGLAGTATGGIQQAVPPSARAARPPGEWNAMQIRCEGDAVEVTLNGTRVVRAEMNAVPALQGRPRSGYIGLANWKGEAAGTAFRNVRIKNLSAPQSAQAPVPPSPENDGFVPLFNGTDLSGWVNVNCAVDTFTARNGMLYCSGSPNGVLRSVKSYENFVLELEWMHNDPKGNSGVFVWAEATPGPGRTFPRGFEAQLAHGDERRDAQGRRIFSSQGDVFAVAGATMTPAPPHPTGLARGVPQEDRAKPSGQWNHYRLDCRDGVIKLAVNGKVVSGGSNCTPRAGHICLQSEGFPIWFRSIRLLDLSTPQATPAPSPVQEAGFVPLFNGKDLSGWVLDSGDPRSWGVQVGELVTVANPANPGWLLTDRDYTDFLLRLEFQLGPNANSGVGYRALALRDSKTAGALEVQLLDGNPPGTTALKRTGALWSLTSDQPARYFAGAWNTFELEVRGQKVRVAINGQDTVNADLDQFLAQAGTQPALRRRAGRIGLQSWSGSARFRNVEVKELSQK